MLQALGRRAPAALALAVTVSAGLGLRATTDGTIAKVGGVALYGTMIYAVLLMARQRTPPLRTAVAACLVCWAIEFAQLTPFPAEASRHSTPARLVLGSTFNAPDLLAYPAGILLATVLQLGLRQLLRGDSSDRAATAADKAAAQA
jgi:uncharacterized protein DUF2809